VALVPDLVPNLTKAGHDVVVQTGAGAAAGFPDTAYTGRGAQVEPEVFDTADILLKVQPPTVDEIGGMQEGSTLIGFLQPHTNASGIQALAVRQVTAFSMELMPRITRAQPMDALSSQSTVAGYMAALLAASSAGRFFPMLVTAAGTVPPAKALVLGAGVAGLQAIATARRLGAMVHAYDIRPAVKEQVESLGAAFLASEIQEETETAGGYAKQLSEEAHRREVAFVAQHVRDADAVISTALIPGRRAPILITQRAVEGMRPGSVIVDLAAESGGNCALTQPGRDIVHRGVLVLGPVNLPSTLPQHASQMYAKNISSFLLHLARDGRLQLDFSDQITSETCVTHEGKVRQP
jgi:NAD(P) transhydrogenase subunit alpha